MESSDDGALVHRLPASPPSPLKNRNDWTETETVTVPQSQSERDRHFYEAGRNLLKEHAAKDSEALRLLHAATVKLSMIVDRIPGRTRPEMDHVAADLEEAGQLLGVMPERPVRRPKSAWPEGEE